MTLEKPNKTIQRSKNILSISIMFLLLYYWFVSDTSAIGFIFILLYAIIFMFKLYFPTHKLIFYFETAIIFGYSFLWSDSLYYLSITFMDISLNRSALHFIVLMTITVLNLPVGFMYIVLIAFGSISGLVLSVINDELVYFKKHADHQRSINYQLDTFNKHLIKSQDKLAYNSQLAERNRIAQELHDHLGHELTAANLALQAFEPLYKENSVQANELFQSAKSRILQSTKLLRDTVYDLKPVEPLDIMKMKRLCDDVESINVDFNVYGDYDKLTQQQWLILSNVLKEGLTNALKHSEPSKICVVLNVTNSIIRLEIINDKLKKNNLNHLGLGLRNLKIQISAIGGFLSFNEDDHFRLVCVLKLRNEG